MLRFAYTESMCDPALYPGLAQAAERNGFDTYLVPDSICYPRESDAQYPYTATGERDFLDGCPFIDPLIQIAAMGAVTERIEFLTFVLKAPIRNPVLLSKQTTSTAVMTDNRLLLGIGLSPWPEDYQVCAQAWERRGARLDEMIEILRGLESGAYYGHEGEFYQLPEIKLCPVPSQPTPILIGGHSDAALRRAVRLSDGWVHAGAGGRDDTVELEQMIGRLHQLRTEYGVEDKPFRIFALSALAYTPEGLKRLESLGVTDVGVAFRDPYTGVDRQPMSEKLDLMQQYAEGIMVPWRRDNG